MIEIKEVLPKGYLNAVQQTAMNSGYQPMDTYGTEEASSIYV